MSYTLLHFYTNICKLNRHYNNKLTFHLFKCWILVEAIEIIDTSCANHEHLQCQRILRYCPSSRSPNRSLLPHLFKYLQELCVFLFMLQTSDKTQLFNESILGRIKISTHHVIHRNYHIHSIIFFLF